MKPFQRLIWLVILIFFNTVGFGEERLSLPVRNMSFNLSLSMAEQIGKRIWENECSGKIERLTWWNEGEEFASVGINHFIWYPKDTKGVYEETFPSLLGFMQKHGVVVPLWLNNHPPCPWKTRKDFMNDFETTEMVELRKFLYRTKHLQVQFMAERLQNSLKTILEKAHVKNQFLRVLNCKKGQYILLDYYNFKGAGTASTEQYNGYGWGLLQVLEEMQDNDYSADFEFVRAARKILERRVANAPPSRKQNEERWLRGWLNRIKSYE